MTSGSFGFHVRFATTHFENLLWRFAILKDIEMTIENRPSKVSATLIACLLLAVVLPTVIVKVVACPFCLSLIHI